MFQADNSFIRSWSVSGGNISPEKLTHLFKHFTGGRIIYRTRHKACYLVDFPEYGGEVVVKHYFEKRFWRYFLRPSLAYREFLGFNRAESCGIPVAEVVALGEKRNFWHLKEAFFVTRYLAGYRDGNEFIHGNGDEKLKDEFVRRNLELLAKLHNGGFVHGCFHPRNELFKVDDSGKMDIIWIDLASVIPVGKTRKFTKAGDLDRFLCEFDFSAEKEVEYRAYYAQMRKK